MKTILCFGDSNTYGERPDGGGRYERGERWTGRLQSALSGEYLIVEEGLNGRTTVWSDPVEGDKCGIKHLPTCLESHAPLDLVILMLGTNDLKVRFCATPTDISLGAEALVRLVLFAQNGRREQPPRCCWRRRPFCSGRPFWEKSSATATRTRCAWAPSTRTLRGATGVEFINIAEYAQPSTLDGLHFDSENHAKVAAAFERKIRQIFL